MRQEAKWVIASPPDDHPGYLGARRTVREQEWTQRYGEEGWRFRWQTSRETGGRIMGFDEVFQVYVAGYEQYFRQHLDEANYLISNYAYGYDLDPITKEQAFDPHALFDKPGVRNQFHNVAFNIALRSVTGKDFQGTEPLQVRDSRPGTPVEERPAGWRWSPGRIPCVDPTIIPQGVTLTREQWWENGSIEDFYQKAKILQVRRYASMQKQL